MVQTPNLDRLAAEGVNFTHAFTPNPLCTPARNSLLFGQWSFQHRVLANPDTEFHRGPLTDAVSFSSLLAGAGWDLAYVGKWHVSHASTPSDAQFGFNSYVAEDELYNLADDPAEITNRATDQACAAELQRLRQRLLSWLNETRDPLVLWTGNVQLGEGLTR